jgi:hypothetical protein
MKKRSVTSSFDELLKNHYGDSSRDSASHASSAEDLYASYYGNSASRKEKNGKKKSSVALSLSCDDGEMLSQHHKHHHHHHNCEHHEEYVVQHSINDEPFEEYVVQESGLSMQSSVGGKLESIPAEQGSASEECQVDIFPPPKKSNIPGSKATPPNAYADEAAYQHARSGDRPSQESYAGQSPSSKEETSRAKSAEDDFIADMQSILSGQMVYDPGQKKMVDRSEVGKTPPPSSSQNGVNEPPLPEAKNSQAIFDRIAQSMAFANTYDLGTVELENRFSDFDRISEIEQKAAKENKAKPRKTPSTVSPSGAPPVDSADFIRDLDAIRQGHYGTSARPDSAASSSMSLEAQTMRGSSDSACIPWALSLSSTDDPADFSRPLYETGEHVRMGWDLYSEQLHVGKSPGVLFSYGEMIAMGDLYQSVSQMIGAEESELRELKNLIAQSTRHFTGKGDEDVTNKQWEAVTNKRFLELAEENYHHFSPDVLFADTVFGKNLGKHLNNKTTWEKHHKWAIQEAQKLLAAQGSTGQAVFLEWPLIINGFGDHFLTDAFASGHVINKEAIMEYYKYNFYNGNSLKPEAEKFFERLAKLSFKDEVKQKFSVLETYEGVLPFGVGHPNVDSAFMFGKLLKNVAEQKPDQIANLAVKALHDKLNTDGIEVMNDAGDKPWRLTGDNTLNDENLKIIKKAVQQSVDNVNDPAINTPNLNFEEYYAKVWKYVPKLTEASKQKVKQLAKDYTSPTSEVLVQAAAVLVAKEVDTLISKLRDAKALRDA